ncbi:MAG TPA: hypothetical protein DEP42_02385 [Ruminococcaceae bacterium]|nr:hypothetical protein [Oscillospiraceae bacterium]
MNYQDLAHEFIDAMREFQIGNARRQANETLMGKNFILFFLSGHVGDVIPSDISRAMGTTPARVAAALNSLEKEGIITRRIDPSDRRRILVELTVSGEKQAKVQDEIRLASTANMLEYLGEKDAKNYLNIMKKLASRKIENSK